MRIYIIVLFTILLGGCVEHPNTKNIDLVAVEKAANDLYFKTKVAVVISEDKIPEIIRNLNPLVVRVDAYGVYIVMDRSFSKESGLMVSDQFGSIISMGGNADWLPEMKRVQGNIYTYIQGSR